MKKRKKKKKNKKYKPEKPRTLWTHKHINKIFKDKKKEAKKTGEYYKNEI